MTRELDTSQPATFPNLAPNTTLTTSPAANCTIPPDEVLELASLLGTPVVSVVVAASLLLNVLVVVVICRMRDGGTKRAKMKALRIVAKTSMAKAKASTNGSGASSSMGRCLRLKGDGEEPPDTPNASSTLTDETSVKFSNQDSRDNPESPDVRLSSSTVDEQFPIASQTPKRLVDFRKSSSFKEISPQQDQHRRRTFGDYPLSEAPSSNDSPIGRPKPNSFHELLERSEASSESSFDHERKRPASCLVESTPARHPPLRRSKTDAEEEQLRRQRLVLQKRRQQQERIQRMRQKNKAGTATRRAETVVKRRRLREGLVHLIALAASDISIGVVHFVGAILFWSLDASDFDERIQIWYVAVALSSRINRWLTLYIAYRRVKIVFCSKTVVKGGVPGGVADPLVDCNPAVVETLKYGVGLGAALSVIVLGISFVLLRACLIHAAHGFYLGVMVVFLATMVGMAAALFGNSGLKSMRNERIRDEFLTLVGAVAFIYFLTQLPWLAYNLLKVLGFLTPATPHLWLLRLSAGATVLNYSYNFFLYAALCRNFRAAALGLCGRCYGARTEGN